MALLIIEIALGFSIGLVLGLLGGGGSILTVPALVYVVRLSPHAAITASLVIVGLNSLTGVWFHRSQGTLNWRVALIFGGVGMVTAYLAAGLSSMFPPTALMIAFAVLMMAVGILMIVRKPPREDEERTTRGMPVIIASGAIVGVLTGFLGVGGGFLIVPALVMLVGLSVSQAVGTSLMVIAMNSLAGVLGHLGNTSLDIGLLALFVGAGIAGTFIGTRLVKRLRSNQLQYGFAIFVIMLALFLLYDNVSKMIV
ncbi:MAG: sulfite exporter TauE/SafE family protein [Chloroflexaceae bacterium]|nr:sulfite exporter TauE/SafE family protein [Chloroflexaceae bacterium]